jgi:hypothetical protein
VYQVLNGIAHERRLIEHDLRHELLRHVEQVGDRSLDAVDHRDRVGIAALLEDRQINGRLPVNAHNVVLDLRRVLRLTDVGHHDG